MCTNNWIEIQSQGYKYLKAESILSCKVLVFSEATKYVVCLCWELGEASPFRASINYFWQGFNPKEYLVQRNRLLVPIEESPEDATSSGNKISAGNNQAQRGSRSQVHRERALSKKTSQIVNSHNFMEERKKIRLIYVIKLPRDTGFV